MLFNRPQSVPKPPEPTATDDANGLREVIFQELLRQARYSYNLALAITAGSALMILGGVGLLYFGRLPAASITTAGGAIASISCIQLAKESKEELRQVLERLP